MSDEIMSKKGNSKVVEACSLKELIITQRLQRKSHGKKFSRHWCNCALYLDVNEYSLLNFMVYMSSRAVSVFTYSTLLLKQYAEASERACEIYGSVNIKHNTSTYNARKTFISLVEKGIFLRMTGKNKFMINPMLVYNSNLKVFSYNSAQEDYQYIISKYSGNKLVEELKLYCDGIEEWFKNFNKTRENGI